MPRPRAKTGGGTETKNKQACGYGVLLSANQHLSNQVLFLYQNSERSKTMIDQKFLESLGVTDESTVQKITETYTADIKAEQDAATATKTQLDEANKTIQSYKDMDIDGIKQAADDWKTKAEKAKSDADAQISELKFDYALSAALTGARARNSKAVKALLDMDGLKLNDGKIIGLDEQLSQIKEENGFLFESDEPAPTIVKGTNGGSGGIGGKKPSEMTYSELCDYMEQNPGAEI